MLYIDRFDAALKLIPGLRNYRNSNGIIYAIPGGGVPIGYYVSKEFNFPLNLMLSKKMNHPKLSEPSIGAVSVSDHLIDERLNIPASHVKNEIFRIRQSFKDRYSKMIDGQHKTDVKNKMVFLVDDGMVTGNTMLAAVRAMKALSPKKIIVVVPVSSASAAKKIEKEVDDFYCLHILKHFGGLSVNYLNFSPVTDKEIHQLLKAANRLENAA